MSDDMVRTLQKAVLDAFEVAHGKHFWDPRGRTKPFVRSVEILVSPHLGP